MVFHKLVLAYSINSQSSYFSLIVLALLLWKRAEKLQERLEKPNSVPVQNKEVSKLLISVMLILLLNSSGLLLQASVAPLNDITQIVTHTIDGVAAQKTTAMAAAAISPIMSKQSASTAQETGKVITENSVSKGSFKKFITSTRTTLMQRTQQLKQGVISRFSKLSVGTAVPKSIPILKKSGAIRFNVLSKVLRKVAPRFFLKAVLGLNVVSAAYDVYQVSKWIIPQVSKLTGR
jgi:hypothetical protein